MRKNHALLSPVDCILAERNLANHATSQLDCNYAYWNVIQNRISKRKQCSCFSSLDYIFLEAYYYLSRIKSWSFPRMVSFALYITTFQNGKISFSFSKTTIEIILSEYYLGCIRGKIALRISWFEWIHRQYGHTICYFVLDMFHLYHNFGILCASICL